jgi:hypothetical protein
MAIDPKYLSAKEISEILGDVKVDASFELMSSDSYNETLIVEAIKATGQIDQLCEASINLSCIGWGNQKYGSFKVKNTVVDIVQLLTDCHVKVRQPKDAKLKEGDLTPQRLCRAFRYYIRDYIRQKNVQTYLYRKYSDQSPRYAHLLFRGSEYLDDLKEDEVHYILKTYETMDNLKNLKIASRIRRVFQAKGYLKGNDEL